MYNAALQKLRTMEYARTATPGRGSTYAAYYPFGLAIDCLSWQLEKNPYLYNGKELHTQLNMNLHDYGARYYDAAVGRWWSIDPLAEKMRSFSPYSYAFNNPIRFIDIGGMIPWPVVQKSNNLTRKIVSGMIRNDKNHPKPKHGGVDIAYLKDGKGFNQNSNENVNATHTGTITIKQRENNGGNTVYITNGDIRTVYMHLQSTDLGGGIENGKQVNEGQKIGVIGQSGASNPHLHYAIEEYENGKWVPMNPVVGSPDKVSASDEVDLIDPQKIIGGTEGNQNSENTSGDRSQSVLKQGEIKNDLQKSKLPILRTFGDIISAIF